MKLIFLDTETTSVAPVNGNQPRLVSLGFQLSEEDKPTVAYFNPPTPITYSAMGVHGITHEMVADRPLFEGHEIHKWLTGEIPQRILIAHNAEFDVGILKNEGITNIPFTICTMKVASWILKDAEGHSLSSLRYQYKLPVDGHSPHDVGFDVVMLTQLFKYLFDTMQALHPEKDERTILADMATMSKIPRLQKQAYTKKHKGKTWEQVAREDPDYMRWMMTTDFDLETMFSVQYWLAYVNNEEIDFKKAYAVYKEACVYYAKAQQKAKESAAKKSTDSQVPSQEEMQKQFQQ